MNNPETDDTQIDFSLTELGHIKENIEKLVENSNEQPKPELKRFLREITHHLLAELDDDFLNRKDQNIKNQ